MELVIVPLVAFAASWLTFLSGFGLGTLLTPAFLLFFPVEVAVASTAVVHLLNNLFKLALVGRHARRDVVLRFGLPALVAAFLGALVLVALAGMRPLFSYRSFGREFDVVPLELVVAVLLAGFTLLEAVPSRRERGFDRRHLPIGGLLTGFVGGISGQQGALRSAFLVKLGISKEAYLGTGVVIACMVDVARLPVYVRHLAKARLVDHAILLVAATAAAFAGAWLGNRLLKKVTMQLIQRVVTAMLLLIAVALGAGVL